MGGVDPNLSFIVNPHTIAGTRIVYILHTTENRSCIAADMYVSHCYSWAGLP